MWASTLNGLAYVWGRDGVEGSQPFPNCWFGHIYTFNSHSRAHICVLNEHGQMTKNEHWTEENTAVVCFWFSILPLFLFTYKQFESDRVGRLTFSKLHLKLTLLCWMRYVNLDWRSIFCSKLACASTWQRPILCLFCCCCFCLCLRQPVVVVVVVHSTYRFDMISVCMRRWMDGWMDATVTHDTISSIQFILEYRLRKNSAWHYRRAFANEECAWAGVCDDIGECCQRISAHRNA